MRLYIARATENIKKFRKPICILTAIYALGISAILRANFYYIDDMGRAFWGYRGFYYFSRYISEYLSVLVHADTHLTDISPLPQLLAVVILAVSGVIVLHLITEKDRFTWIEYVAMVPLGLSPYFLECISYKFDAPYMALSIFASVVPLLFEKRGKAIYILSIVLGMLAVCMSYQAASGIFPMLVVLLALKRWNNKESLKSLCHFVILSVVGYLIGMLFFALVIMRPAGAGDYASTSIPILSELIPITGYNLKNYYYVIWQDFKKEWLILIAILCIGFLYVTVRESKQKWYYALLMGIAVLLLLLIMAFGLYPVLENPIFEPRAMYGFGALLCFIAVFAVSPLRLPKAWTYSFIKIICFALCWCFFVFAFTYGNALYVQKTYTDYRICAVIDDLDELGVLEPEESKTVQIVGTIGKAPALEAMRQDFQMLNRLVPIVFCDSSWDWGSFGFDNYYGLNNYLQWDSSIDLTALNLPIVKDSIYHTIRADSDYILIELKY